MSTTMGWADTSRGEVVGRRVTVDKRIPFDVPSTRGVNVLYCPLSTRSPGQWPRVNRKRPVVLRNTVFS